MERLKRKLMRLGTSVMEVADEQELLAALQGNAGSLVAVANGGTGVTRSARSGEGGIQLPLYRVMLAVDESAIILLQLNDPDSFAQGKPDSPCGFIIREQDIVENMEVAVSRLSHCRSLRGKALEILRPDEIPAGGIVFIIKQS